MKRFARAGASLLAGLCVSMSTVALSQAAVSQGENRFSFRVGGAFPTSANDFSDTAKTALMGGLQYLRQIGPALGVGAQVDGFLFPAKDRVIVVPAGRLNAKSEASVTTVEMIGRYSFHAERKVVPYAVAGVGLTMFSEETEASPANGTTWADTGTRETRTLADDSSTGYALSFGGGVEFPLAPRLIAGLEATWHIFGVDGDEFGTDTINVPSAALRLGWIF